MGVNGDKKPGVNVTVITLDGSRNLTQKTTKSGFFHFWLKNGAYMLEISANGYVSQSIKIDVSR